MWKTQISGSNDVEYSITFNSSYIQDTPLGTMTILAVPQQLTQETKLTVVYSVDEDNNQETSPAEYTEVFDLFDLSTKIDRYLSVGNGSMQIFWMIILMKLLM